MSTSSCKLYFIVNDDKTEETMKHAFYISKEYTNNSTWQKDTELNIKLLEKTDIVVLGKFSGEFYESLKNSQCVRILGPQALIDCMVESKDIPNYPWPIFNVAMYGLIISCSTIPRAEKLKIKEQVQLMGGCYSEQLSEKTSHLITDCAKSEKYSVAAERGIRIMLPSWVEAIWGISQSDNIHATDDRFNDLICLPFHKLKMCSTGITNSALRKELAKIIDENGGSLVGKMDLSATDVLICYGDDGLNSQKYKAARTCVNIKCVTVDWIYESVKKGYALRTDNYQVRNKATSTPTMDGLPNFSTISEIGGPNLTQTANVEETVNMTSASNFDFGTPKKGNRHRSQTSKMPATSNFGQSEDTLAALLKNMDNVDFTADQIAANRNANSQSGSSIITEQETSRGCLFTGYKFMIGGFDEDEIDALIENIESESGVVLSEESTEQPDYVVLPPFIPSEMPTSSHVIVSSLWINEVIQNGTIIDVAYYHRPFVLEDGVKPLENCVVTISSYTGYERQFLIMLIVKLGGISQEQFARLAIAQKDILASTHLVSLEMSGKKYNAALKWQLPVVTKDWLLECAKANKLLPEKDYALGDKGDSKTTDEICETPANRSDEDNTYKGSSLEKPATPITLKRSPVKHVEQTPKNQLIHFGGYTPGGGSQVTPVDKILEEARRNNLLDAQDSPRRYYPWDPKTPDTPKGGIASTWSPQTRKDVEIFINMLPDFVPPTRRRPSTPLHVLNERLRKKFFPDSDDDNASGSRTGHSTDIDDVFLKDSARLETTPENMVATKIQQLEEMVTTSGGNRRKSRNFQSTLPAPAAILPSQPFTVSWDYTDNKENLPIERIFILSGIENEQRQEIRQQIIELGGQVSDLPNYDSSITHMLCIKPTRNEKTLSCMASGKWILHASYIEKCFNEGKFVGEEEFEFGNPKCKYTAPKSAKDMLQRIKAMHWWRKEIERTGRGAFHDMKAIVVASNKQPIIRVIEAGGGMVIDAQPPFEGKIHATHCLIEAKSAKNMTAFNPLAEQGIYCVNTMFISDFLHKITNDILDSAFPQFAMYYAKN